MVKFLDLQAITAMHGDEYKAAVNRVVDSGWFLQGRENQQFEADYAQYVGTDHCVAVANGLDALYLLLRGYKEMGVMKDGDEIIVPANTFIATILAITRNNLVPVLVEPTFEHLELDVERVEDAITAKTRGVMTVHLYGRIAYNDMLGEICRRHHLKLMEDCAQSHGCGFKSQVSGFKRTGALGDVAAHSFYPGKNLGAFGDAGAVTTDDAELAAVVRALANYGSQEKYVFDYLGRNSRIDEIQAAILDVKLKYLDEANQRRKEIASLYINKVNNPLILIPQSDRDSVWHIFPILCERRDELQAYLKANGVETQIHYPIPPHQQKCYSTWGQLLLPVTERIHREELSIPCHPAITKEEADKIIRLLNSFI